MTAVLAGLVTLGLVLLAVLRDLDTAGQTSSVAGAVVGMAALLVSVITLFRSSGGGGGRRVRAGRGGVAAGRNITGSALGDRSKVTGFRTRPSAGPAREGTDDVHAGRDGVAAGGDITDSALGEDSQR
ncbi:hypothetical protein ABZ192_02545 [Streptomyces sp. NPDC006235]|uniref:hypothetical protein n=1 Tax=Streptomyces sp. NPDC006235 TaxID=3156736 RepID=UPI00339E800E